MLTQKEIKFLNFLYKKLGGKHLPTLEVAKFIEEKISLAKDKAYELAYLYDHNFDQSEGEDGMGNFGNVTEPERETYEEYQQRLPWQLKAVMEATGDDNPDNFEFEEGDDYVMYNGDEYRIYNDESEIRDVAEGNDLGEMLCEERDPDPYYIYMTDTDRRIFAHEESDYQVGEMDDDEVIDRANIEDEIEELNALVEKKEKLSELEDELGDAESDEEIERIQSEIDELESEIGDVEDVESRIQKLIENAREDLKSEIYDEIYNELDDPIRYFIDDHGFYADAGELLANGPVQYDCDKYVEDYLDNADIDSIVSLAGYSSWEEVKTEEHGYVFVVWN